MANLDVNLGTNIDFGVRSGSAVIKFLRVSPQKVRRVVNLVRGKDLTIALAILDALPNRPVVAVKKAILSAVSNAGGAIGESWVVKKISVDGGMKIKRFRPRARGRIYSECSQLSNLSVVVSDAASKGGSHGA